MSGLILFNANVITMDPSLPRAKLISIRNGRIESVRTNDRFEGLTQKGPEWFDCQGMTILPGFIDTHCHFLAMAERFVTLNLEPRNNARSISDIQSKIQELSQKLSPGSWIRGKGYNEFYLREKRHPNRWDLDPVAPEHPVKLTHRTGRAHVLNSLGLKLAQISKETPDPEGGLIERDFSTGEPTGLLFGMGDLLAKIVPPVDPRKLKEGVRLANRRLLASGITSIQDTSPHNRIEQWEILEHCKTSGLLDPKVNMMLGFEGFAEGRQDEKFSPLNGHQGGIKGVKVLLDETTGCLYPNEEMLNQMVLDVHRSGLQVSIHALEEKSIEAACSAVEEALKRFPKSDHRHRIEHCAICPPSLAKRLVSLGIMVVTQPPFIYYNGERYLKTIPDGQLKYLYPIATLIKHGVTVAGSSDFPVVPENPLIGIFAAISRKAETEESVSPEERITPLEALKMYTIDAARATFEENIKGSITPGKLADLVVLNGDPLRLPSDEIRNLRVEFTIINGKVVWNRKEDRG